jgi:hypothetical protein
MILAAMGWALVVPIWRLPEAPWKRTYPEVFNDLRYIAKTGVS